MTNWVLDKEGWCRPQQKDSGPLPKTPAGTLSIFYPVGRVCTGWRPHSTLWHKQKSTILHQCTQVWLSTLSAPSGYPITAKNYATVDSVNGHKTVIFVWSYSLFLVDSFINLGQITPIVWEGFPHICRGQHRSPFPLKGAAPSPSDTDAQKCHCRRVSALQASALPGGRETAR